jgi:hypothetical protein
MPTSAALATHLPLPLNGSRRGRCRPRRRCATPASPIRAVRTAPSAADPQHPRRRSLPAAALPFGRRRRHNGAPAPPPAVACVARSAQYGGYYGQDPRVGYYAVPQPGPGVPGPYRCPAPRYSQIADDYHLVDQVRL